MAKLIYITNASVDGYIEDETGAFDWVDPGEVHHFITELLRPVGTVLLGRRLHETMAYWDAPVAEYPAEYRAFAQLWQNVDKIVFSRSLTAVTTPNTRIEHDFDVEAIRSMKAAATRDLSIGGAALAGLALEANLIDECHLFINPVVVGRGKPAFQIASGRFLEPLHTRRFNTGVVYVRYRVSAEGASLHASIAGR